MARVLVVDDERGLRVSIKAFLRNDGHNVETAQDTETARNLLKEHDFDVVVSDIVMPKENGMVLLEYIYNNKPEVETIMMTGEPTIKSAVQAMRLGAFDFIAKPIAGKELCSMVRDAAKRKSDKDKSRLELKESKAQYKRLTENARDMIWQSDPSGTIEYVNPAVIDILGYTVEECIGKRSFEYLTRNSLDKMKRWFQEAQNNNKNYSQIFGELDMIHKDGSIVTCEINSVLVKDEYGNVCSIEGITRNLTERKKVEEQLETSKANLTTLIENTNDLIAYYDKDCKLLSFNKSLNERCKQFLGIELKPGMPFEYFIDIIPSFIKNNPHLRVLKGESFIDEIYFDINDEEKRYAEISYFPIWKQETVAGFITYTRDITNRKLSEIELKDSRERLQQAQRVANVGSYEYDIETHKVIWSDELLRIYGLPIDEPDIRHSVDRCRACVHPDDADKVFNTIRKGVESNKKVVCEHRIVRNNDGVIRTVVSITEPIRDKDGQVNKVVGTVQDITERKNTEESLKRSEEKFRNIFEFAGIGMVLCNAEGKFMKVNQAFCNMFGYKEEELLQKSYGDLTHPDYVESDKQTMQQLLYGKTTNYQKVKNYIHKNGTVLTGILNLSIIRDQHDRPSYVIGQIQDITKQRQAEEERSKIQERLSDIQRIDSLTNMASGIGHDLNNLLTGIIGNTDLLLMDLPADSEQYDTVQDIESSASKAADLAKQMLAYSGNNRMNISKCNLSEMVEEISGLLDSSVNPKISIELDLNGSMPDIDADINQLKQVLANLVNNSAEAIGNKTGLISISTGIKKCSSEYLSQTHLDDDLPDGEYAYLQVKDNGCGIDKQNIKKVFDPFYTTKINGKGLGMPAVLGIVRAHCGAIMVESEPDEGSNITIMLPFIEPKTQLNIPRFDQSSVSSSSRHYTVMVVDDEKLVRKTAQRALERTGIKVLTAEDGQKAVDMYTEQLHEIDLVILDKTMPILDGLETLKKLLELNPEIKVIMSSGYSEKDMNLQFSHYKISGILHKPFRACTLVDKVCKVLNCKFSEQE